MAPEGAFKNRAKTGATLEEVARHAGVSPATVSRCLNSPDLVRPALKSKVEAAIRLLDYVPHGGARSLASRRSRMIGAIFPILDTTLFGRTLEALQQEVGEAGYTLVVASYGYDLEREQHHVRNLLTSGIDALVLVGGIRDDSVYRLIERNGVPYVLIWISESDGGRPCIGFDNAEAARRAARHLLDMGHSRIGVISGFVKDNDRAAARIVGTRSALAERGLTLDESLVLERPFGSTEGREAFRLLMTRQPRPTAVICGSEPFAYGALFEAQALGLKVPDEVSITGFDDFWLAAQMTPGLTTVRTPQSEMGRLAGRHLLSVLAGEEAVPPAPLDVELIVRGSTGPPREDAP